MGNYSFSIIQDQAMKLFSNKKLSILACSISSDMAVNNELLRCITLDIASFNNGADLEVYFDPSDKKMTYPSVKTLSVNGITRKLTCTFSQPVLLQAGQQYKINIRHILVKESALLKTETITATITTTRQYLSGKQIYRKSSTIQLSPVIPAIQGFRIAQPLLHQFGKLHLHWQSEDISAVKISTVFHQQLKEKLYKVSEGDKQWQLPLPNLLKDLGMSRKEVFLHLSVENETGWESETRKHGSIELIATLDNDISSLKKAKIIQENMWYRYENDNGVRLVDLISVECDKKIWGIAPGPSANQLELWYNEEGFDWKPAGVRVEWDALRAMLTEAIQMNGLTETQALYHLPPAIIKKRIDDYQLFFIGGSKFEAKLALNTMFSCVFNITTNVQTVQLTKLTVIGDGFKPVAGHCITLFGYDNQPDCIWIIGGMDSSGNGLNTIRVFKGNEWISQNIPGFPLKCQFNTTVYTNPDKEKEIWVAGGFTQFEGPSSKEIWRYAKINGIWAWEKVVNEFSEGIPKQLKVPGVYSTISADTITAFENEGASYIHYLAVLDNNKIYSGKVEKPGGKKRGVGYPVFNFAPTHPVYGGGWSDTPRLKLPDNSFKELQQLRNYIIKSVGYGGCIWLLAFRYYSEDGVNLVISDVYFMKPETVVTASKTSGIK